MRLAPSVFLHLLEGEAECGTQLLLAHCKHLEPHATDMHEHVLLFCLLTLVLTATIILVAALGAVTWALALIE